MLAQAAQRSRRFLSPEPWSGYGPDAAELRAPAAQVLDVPSDERRPREQAGCRDFRWLSRKAPGPSRARLSYQRSGMIRWQLSLRSRQFRDADGRDRRD